MERYLGDAALDQAVRGDVLKLLIAVFPHHCADVAYGLRRGALGSCQRTERRVMVSGHLNRKGNEAGKVQTPIQKESHAVLRKSLLVSCRYVTVSQHGNKRSVISLIRGQGQRRNIAAQTQKSIITVSYSCCQSYIRTGDPKATLAVAAPAEIL